MLTEFGKQLRKIRIDHEETLVAMARKLGVSASLLSYVELGKRTIPQTWCDLIITQYNLNNAQANELRKAETNSTNNVNLDLEGMDSQAKSIAVGFARRLPELTEEELNEIKAILSKMENK